VADYLQQDSELASVWCGARAEAYQADADRPAFYLSARLVSDPSSPLGYRRSPELQDTFDRAARELVQLDSADHGGRRPGLRADLVLEGGGAKGIGLVGAVLVLDEAGFQFSRAAGNSAGAITAALIAALVQTGGPMIALKAFMDDLRYSKFIPEGKLRRFLDNRIGKIGSAVADFAMLTQRVGLYDGDYLREWLSPILCEQLGIRTFGDLKIGQSEDPEMSLPAERQYRLVVAVGGNDTGACGVSLTLTPVNEST
jgi:hypothetical protein